MEIRKLKDGYVHRYKTSFLSSKWKNYWAVLFSDSILNLYNRNGDSRPAESIFFKNVVPYICVGHLTDRMPVRRPALPNGVEISRLVGIGLDPKAETIHWILFPTEENLSEWFTQIISTLPIPRNVSSQQHQTTSKSGLNVYVPPSCYPVAPQYNQFIPPNENYNPNARHFGQSIPSAPPSYNTVIIDRSRSDRTSDYLGAGLGLGGGLLLGSLFSYGIGSFFTPHYGYNGSGCGFGSGFPACYSNDSYFQNNDTYITNNYNTDDHSSSVVNNYIDSTNNNTDNTANNDNDSNDNDNYDMDDAGLDNFDVGFDGIGGDW